MRWYDYLMAGLYDYMKCTEGGAAVVEEAAAVEVEARRYSTFNGFHCLKILDFQ